MHADVAHDASSRQRAIPRVDLYADIHKALRACMADALVVAGRTDPSDPDEVRDTLATVRALLDQCAAHIDKENAFVHPAIEARVPGASMRIAEDHDDHLRTIAGLEADVGRVERAATPLRGALLQRLYLRLARFVAENFEHMDVEETRHNEALWACYSDAELIAIHDRLIASIPPEEMMGVLHWMVPSVNAPSRALLFASMRDAMPAPAFDGVLAFAQARLAPRERAKLAAALVPLRAAA